MIRVKYKFHLKGKIYSWTWLSTAWTLNGDPIYKKSSSNVAFIVYGVHEDGRQRPVNVLNFAPFIASQTML
jgi:hypothetical protein